MYQAMEEVSKELNVISDETFTDEKYLKISQAFIVTARNIDQAASSSQSIQDSMAFAKIHQGMLACGRLMEKIKETTQQLYAVKNK